MAVLTVRGDEVVIQQTAGTAAFLRALDHVRRGDVHGVSGDAARGHLLGQVGFGDQAHTAMARIVLDADGDVADVHGSCTCGSGNGIGTVCEHQAAVLLSGRAAEPQSDCADDKDGARPMAVRTPAAWERSLAVVLGDRRPTTQAHPDASTSQVALQFDWPNDSQPAAIVLRPVTRSHTGGWVRSGISWASLEYGYGYGYGNAQPTSRQLSLLRELLAIQCQDRYSYSKPSVKLDATSSRRVWDLLTEAQESGLQLVRSGRQAHPVIVHSQPARAELQVARQAEGLLIHPRLMVGGTPLALAGCLPIGQPPHGLAWCSPLAGQGRQAGTLAEGALSLAPLASALDPQVVALLGSGDIVIPPADEVVFFRNYYPDLRQRMTITSYDHSVVLPEPAPPVLTLTVVGVGEHRVETSWTWAYAVGAACRVEPLWPDPRARARRDVDNETRIVAAAAAACRDLAGLFEHDWQGLRLAAEATLDGIATARLLSGVLPALAELPDVDVQLLLEGPTPDYRQSDTAPVISFSGEGSAGAHDWFDLAVTVTVDGQEVPFEQLFTALARQEQYLILPSGTYFALDGEEFTQLARLIAESRALFDAPTGTVRVNRFQAGLWAEIERLGVVTGQAAVWQESVRALVDATVCVPEIPDGVDATLRSYQRDGFGWLATLYAHGLGGVLADDMGLGKTLQALVLMQHARQQGNLQTPFLVVAPTSVVGNWATEAARFTPGLTVATISQTQARRGHPVQQLASGADVVITSYTLFRLEFEQYQAISWAGLVLDEAQNVKNHQCAGYRCARTLDTPFKVAITGTPMENNLMELWSLMSITAPGLFPNPARFTEYYRTPIEKGHNGDLLAQLRRRIRPLMLRRTKEQVAQDLPDKQEQVLELDLNPRHRTVYQTYLQRERQKVLGLLGDLRQNRFEIFRSLTLLRQASLDVGLVDAKHCAIPSTKLDALLEQLQDVVAEGHRVLVFSQFTRFLTQARDRLDAAGIEYCYLDGSTTRRASVVSRFRTGTAPVFLISLKAGGVGLNLVEADYVFVLDPWWNPATEAQAVDRVHRIGQTKKVMVYRLVAKDTIEEKVMALKARKSSLISSVLDEGDFAGGALTEDDIRGLLE